MCQGSTGGELLFFLVQKEPAMMPGSETKSPSMLTSALPLSPLLEKCTLVALHLIAEEAQMDVVPWSVGRMEYGLPKESNVGK